MGVLSPRSRWSWLILSAVVIVVDQITKAFIASRPEWGHDPFVVVPGFFEIVSWRNPGALFSLFTDAAPFWRRLVLTVVPMIAVVFILFLMRRVSVTERWSLPAFALVLGGAIGNLIDRIFRGSVVDFLYFGIGYEPVKGWLIDAFGRHHWPAFNVADSCICVGAALIALELLRPAQETTPSP